jgi:hypothetical protein
METTISGVGPVQAVTVRRPDITKPDAPKRDHSGDATAPPPDLAAWFDRNGDGRIDTTTWMNGGDAYLPVGPETQKLLDRAAPSPVAHDRNPVATHAAATAAYRRYGDAATTAPKP